MIPFSCSCGKHYHVADESQGHQIRCPFCYEIRDVPAPPPPPESPRRVRKLWRAWRGALAVAALAVAVPIGEAGLVWLATLPSRSRAALVADEESWQPQEQQQQQQEPKAKNEPVPPPPPVEAPLPVDAAKPPPEPPQPALTSEATEPAPEPTTTPVRPNLAPGAYGVLRSPLYDCVTVCNRWQTYYEQFMSSVSPRRARNRGDFIAACDQRWFLSGQFDTVPNGTPIQIKERVLIEKPPLDTNQRMITDPRKRLNLPEHPRPHNLFQIQITGGPHQQRIGYVAAEYIDPASLSDQPLEYNPDPPNPAEIPLRHPANIPRWAHACPPIFPPWFIDEVKSWRNDMN